MLQLLAGVVGGSEVVHAKDFDVLVKGGGELAALGCDSVLTRISDLFMHWSNLSLVLFDSGNRNFKFQSYYN